MHVSLVFLVKVHFCNNRYPNFFFFLYMNVSRTRCRRRPTPSTELPPSCGNPGCSRRLCSRSRKVACSSRWSCFCADKPAACDANVMFPSPQAVSTRSWWSLVCVWSASTPSSTTAPTKSPATWRTPLDSSSGCRKLCRQLPRTRRRSPTVTFDLPDSAVCFRQRSWHSSLLTVGLHHSSRPSGLPALRQ